MPIFEGLGAECKRAFMKAISIGGFNTELKKKILLAYPYHIINDHRFCTTKCKERKPLMNMNDAIHKKNWENIKEAFAKVAKISQRVLPNSGTQINESFHNSYTLTRNKRKDYKVTGPGRIAAQLCRRMNGEVGLAKIMQKAGFEQSPQSVKMLSRIEEKKQKLKAIQQTTKYKTREKVLAKIKSEHHKKKHEYTYKETDDQLLNITNNEKKRKLPICTKCGHRRKGHQKGKPCPLPPLPVFPLLKKRKR
jgi:hypothetical protein